MGTFSKWTDADVDRHQQRVGRKRSLTQSESTDPEQPYRKNSQELERDIQDEIEAWLRTQIHRAWWDRKRMDMKTTSRLGVPDFIGSWSGRAFGLEVKRHGEKATVEQQAELAWLRKSGAATAVVFSKDEAVAFFLSL